jgi:hypothetical protein
LWQVPKDLAIKGDQETFTITVTFETGDLYGKVVASRKVVVERL